MDLTKYKELENNTFLKLFSFLDFSICCYLEEEEAELWSRLAAPELRCN